MDDLTPMVEVLLRWRITVCLIASSALAFVLSSQLEWFTAKYSVGLVIVSFAGSFVWEGRAESGNKPIQTPTISKPVALLALSFLGVLVGGLISGLTGSVAFATFILGSAPSAVAAWRVLIDKEPVSVVDIAFWTFSLLSAWSALLAWKVVHG
ncbi:MAG: hypothetical protein Q8M11_07185 [Sulfuritalea sp.]|nr:hypothetical protein [Sulfuritalea sp.]MDP1983226.1 hypothetical protein [Sulfuritalea sp.]